MINDIGVVCHDAGGSELLSHWIKHEELKVSCFLKGPAIEIFKRVLGQKSEASLNDLFKKCKTLIVGTSWQSSLEKEAIVQAKVQNIKTIVMLDHWIDYKSRLIYKGSLLKPDEIWVTDNHAKELASLVFNFKTIKLKQNYYIQSMVDKVSAIDYESDVKNTILFIGENTSEFLKETYSDESLWRYNELTSLELLLENIDSLCLTSPNIIIRPHPSEKHYKYLPTIDKFNDLNIKISIEKNLYNDISKSSIVVGAESMALVVALHAGRRVISSIPENCKEISLPYKQIENILDIIQRS
ncbi:hypothetical protein [Prochlorococcus sp. MIT 1307]|uniref:hypothetical protein n=1 Tax=Prochlorococcus sp. MIT 1307 TaxID=3096219 RepID=UPI002A761769|nr:hypothetical protein [Prochlorococcus sp. MIT 1307]